MNLFAIFKQGIQRHECAGIFSSLDKAKEVADELAVIGDRYHHYEIVQFELDKRTLFSVPHDFERFADAQLFEPKPVYSTRDLINAK